MAIDHLGSAPVSQPTESVPASNASTSGSASVDWSMMANAMLGANVSEQTRASIQGLNTEDQHVKENRQAERLINEDEKKKTDKSTKAFIDQKVNEEKLRVDNGGEKLAALYKGMGGNAEETPRAKQTTLTPSGGRVIASKGNPSAAKTNPSTPQAVPTPLVAKSTTVTTLKPKTFVSNAATQRTPTQNPSANPLPPQPQKLVQEKFKNDVAKPQGEDASPVAESTPEVEAAPQTTTTSSQSISQGARTQSKADKAKAKFTGEAENPSDFSSNAPQANEEKGGVFASADSNAGLVEKKNKERLERHEDQQTVDRVSREAGSAGQVEVPEEERISWKEMREHHLESTDAVGSSTAEASAGLDQNSFDPQLSEKNLSAEKTKLKRKIYAASINGNTDEIDALMRDYAAAHDQVKANRAPGGPVVAAPSKARGKDNVTAGEEADDSSMGGIKQQLAQLNQNIERLVTGVVESNRMREEGTAHEIRDLKYAITRTKPFNPVDQQPVSSTYTSNLYETRFQKTDPLRSAYQDVASGKADARQAASLNPAQEQADALGFKPDAIKKNKNPGRANLA